ncbi:MAG: nucleotide exchange factor GrpE [Desulfosarcina sp.]|nr:nucleotide exchange factor GrpE [Desulfosarcina sp.]
MAQKKKIVIEDENEKTPQNTPSRPSAPDRAADKSADAADPLKDFEEKLAAVQAEASENHDRMLRMAAELDNFKKRAARELDDLKKYATENLIRQLLTVVDNLERAIASAVPDNIQALGAPFDPAFHQAMCQEEIADQPPNTVVQEFQKGYLIHDRLLRPTMVVVSKAAQNGQPVEKSVDTNA